MVPGADFAAVAILLAAVEYYIGAGLFSWGISRSLRGNGRDMMENATITMILASSLGMVGAVINMSATVIYGSSNLAGPYEALTEWVNTGCINAQFSIGVITAIQWGMSMFSKAVMGYLPAFFFEGANIGMAPAEPASLTFGSLTGPWIQMLQAGYMVLQVSEVFGTIMKNTWFVFVAFGSLAYALPKRLGRGIGGSLISGAIVYYVGLPLMPQFVAYFLGPTWAHLGLTCSMVQAQMPGYTCDPMYPMSANVFQIWNLAWGVAPAVNFQIWGIFMLPVLYLAMLGAISGGVTKVLQATQLSLFPGGLM